jgi:hypothetical protein
MRELAALIASALDARPQPEATTALRQRVATGPLRYVHTQRGESGPRTTIAP